MVWRVAKSLLILRDQINQYAPHRNKASDGTIGDEHHAHTNSDHNPQVLDGNIGVVTAIDITHDPAQGVMLRRLSMHWSTAKTNELNTLSGTNILLALLSSHGYGAITMAPARTISISTYP